MWSMGELCARVALAIYIFLSKGEEEMMAMLFAQRVILGKTVFEEVPAKLKELVAEILIQAGIPHYAGADSFVISGAFATCGVNYTELGTKTAQMALQILTSGQMPDHHVMDGGIITVNTQTAGALKLDYSVFGSLANTVKEVVTE